MRMVEGDVSILECQGCGRPSPHLIFSGDTDSFTMGLASLTSVTASEIVILESEETEWSDETGRSLETRANNVLSRDDLRFVRLLRTEEPIYPEDLSFQDFCNVYSAPRLAYSCPRCGFGEAVSVRSITPSDYRREGGKLTVLGELKLCG